MAGRSHWRLRKAVGVPAVPAAMPAYPQMLRRSFAKIPDGLAPGQQPWLLRGDSGFDNEPVMREAEQRGQCHLFKLRLTKNVKRAIERAMGEQDWHDAGCRWQGKDGKLRLEPALPHRDFVAAR